MADRADHDAAISVITMPGMRSHETRSKERVAEVLGRDRSNVSRRMKALGALFDPRDARGAAAFDTTAAARAFVHVFDELLATAATVRAQCLLGPVLRERCALGAVDRRRLAELVATDPAELEVAEKELRQAVDEVATLLAPGAEVAA